MAETFYGYVETTQDVLLLFEGCRRGLLPRVCRRLQDNEKKMIRSGSIFVFDELESGIKRWTDSHNWSPSRTVDNFLIYSELDKKTSSGGKRLSISRQRSYSADQSSPMMGISRSRKRRLIGSLSDAYPQRKDGLVKKTISITVNGVIQHLISYYLPDDVLNHKLVTPSSVQDLANLEISPELLKHNFRIPSKTDSNDRYIDVKDISPYRSMSTGSVIQLKNRNYLNQTIDLTPHPLSTQNNLLYSTQVNDSYHHLNNTSTEIYNTSSYPHVAFSYPNSNGFQSLNPTQLTMSSTPTTPMLSPLSQNYSVHHQTRHHSIPSYPIYNQSLSFSYDTTDQQPFYQDQFKQQDSSNPNLDLLLNPVHPLTHHMTQPSHLFFQPQDNKSNYLQSQTTMMNSISHSKIHSTMPQHDSHDSFYV